MDQREAWDDFYRRNRRPWRGVTSPEGGFPFPAGSKILEIGCGTGKTAEALIASGFVVTGVDFSAAAVEECRSRLNGEFLVADAVSLPFADGTFAGAVMFHVLEHLVRDDAEKAVAEAVRVLASGGHLIVGSFAVGDMRAGGDTDSVRGNGIRYHYYTEAEMSSLFPPAGEFTVRTEENGTRFGAVRSMIRADFVKRRAPHDGL
jgi:ubiquinone/menaquinone biosynthesis C-methylase UbiE